jgi:hypothetical protein
MRESGDVGSLMLQHITNSRVTQRQRDHKMQEQQKHVVFPLWLSIYVYFIYCGRFHLYYSFCADHFCSLFSIMCSQLTFYTILQQPARLSLSTQFLSIQLFIAVILRRCWLSFTASPACGSEVGGTAGAICNVRFPLWLEKVCLCLSSDSFFRSRFINLAVRMRHSWSVRTAVSPLRAELLSLA